MNYSREEIIKYGSELIEKLSPLNKGISKITMDDGTDFTIIRGTPGEIKNDYRRYINNRNRNPNSNQSS
jgi:hypothetical protein